MIHRSRESAGPPRPSLTRRVAFATVLALAMGTGTFPAFAFGVLGPELVADANLGRTDLGLLTTVFFTVGGLGSFTAGTVTDRFGARRVMISSFVIVALATVVIAAASGLAWMLAGSALAGISLATGNPTTNKALSEQVVAGRRGLTMGIKQAGVQVAAFLAGALLAPAASQLGWRQALLASALVPTLSVALALIAIPPDGPRRRRGGRTRHAPIPRAVWDLTIYAFLMGTGVAAMTAYLPLYAVEEVGMTTARAGGLVATIGLFGVISRIAWGWGSERLPSFTVPLTGMAAGGSLGIAGILLAPVFGNSLLWIAAVVLGSTAVTWNAVGMLSLLATVEPAEAGRASGIVLFGFYTGYVPSPLVFGGLADLTNDYLASWSFVLTAFAVAGLALTGLSRRTTRSIARR